MLGLPTSRRLTITLADHDLTLERGDVAPATLRKVGIRLEAAQLLSRCAELPLGRIGIIELEPRKLRIRLGTLAGQARVLLLTGFAMLDCHVMNLRFQAV